jgi:hypothetical protein
VPRLAKDDKPLSCNPVLLFRRRCARLGFASGRGLANPHSSLGLALSAEHARLRGSRLLLEINSWPLGTSRAEVPAYACETASVDEQKALLPFRRIAGRPGVQYQ